jgi:hypothetical protein
VQFDVSNRQFLNFGRECVRHGRFGTHL